MATGFATASVNGWMNAYLRNTSYTQPAAFWVKLHTSAGEPGSAGTSNAAANTVRKQATFAAAAGGSCVTSADLAWTSVSNTETYGYVSFWDASAAGTFLGSDDLAVARSVSAGNDFTIASGNMSVAINTLAT